MSWIYLHENRQRVQVPIDQIRAVVFPQNVPADQTTGAVLARLEAREGRRDEVILKTGTETAGIVEEFGFNSLEMSSDRLGSLPIPYENVRAVRIVEETAAPAEKGLRVTVCLPIEPTTSARHSKSPRSMLRPQRDGSFSWASMVVARHTWQRPSQIDPSSEASRFSSSSCRTCWTICEPHTHPAVR